jgi:hypothetical protein
MFRKAKAQGAITGYVHGFSGSGDPQQRGLGGGKAFPIDVALGTVDCLEWSVSSHASPMVWHHALNNDFPIAATGGEDSNTSLHHHTMLGSVRTFAHLGGKLDARAWMDAVARGRSFESNGPLLEFLINQHMPGEAIQLPAGGGEIDVEAQVWSTLPLTRAMIYRNGAIWREVPLGADRLMGTLRAKARVTESGWYSFTAEGEVKARGADPSFPQAVSNPVRVYVGDQKIRSRASAEYFLTWLDKLWKMADKPTSWRSPKEREHVLQQFEEARKVYRQRAAEADQQASATK